MGRSQLEQKLNVRKFIGELLSKIEVLQKDIEDIRQTSDLNAISVSSSDTAPTDDTNLKKLTLQKLSSPPTNAAYIAFSNNPGTDTFYLVLEDAE